LKKRSNAIYNTLMTRISTLLLTLLVLLESCHHGEYSPPKNALFTRLSSSDCGIDFRNDVTDDSVFNEATYRNIYNGGGVAIGDINNDGLPDVFMTANQGKNRLFLNKGNLRFEDITDRAGIVKKQKWSNGVTMVDINGDGLLDIYVSAAGSITGDKHRNALYINQGDLKFKEEADKYQLANEGGIQTQASFSDYDKDGDLDVFLLGNDYSVKTISHPDGSMRNYRNKKTGDKLLRNDNGFFKDVTDSSGIYGAPFGFGLGVSVSDLNDDNWPDIYVSNDFYEKDYLYINQRNGKFSEVSDSYLGHMSYSSMGGDIADLNNDGNADIYTTDMIPEDDYRLKKNTRFDSYDSYIRRYKAGYHYQLSGNMLQLNNGDNTFSEIAQYAGVNATDWSFGTIIFDMNNDGWKDILACNGMYLDVTDQDFSDFLDSQDMRYFFTRESLSDYQLIKKMSVSPPLVNYAFINQHNLTFRNHSSDLGLGQPGYSNATAYADLDRDGDLDLIINNINSECFVYRNNSTEKFGKNYLRVRLQGKGLNSLAVGASVTIFTGGMMQVLQNFPTRGFQSCVEPVLTFGLDSINRIDSLIVNWPDDRSQHLKNIEINRELLLKQVDADANFSRRSIEKKPIFKEITSDIIRGSITHRENDFADFNRELLMPHMLSTEGPKIAVADINGDLLEDFVVGSAKHDTAKVFLQTSDGKFSQLLPQPALAHDKEFEDAGMAFLDADFDGDLDLIVASGGNLDLPGSKLLQPRLYINNGKGIFERDDRRLPSISVNASCVKILDFNADGDPDILIGGRSVPGQYGTTPKSYLLRNDQGYFKDVTTEVAPDLQNIGMVTDAIWVDIDNDNKMELVVVGEWMPVTIFKNENGHLKLSHDLNQQFAFTSGWWNCVKATDIDNDGKLDLIAGNLGLNTKIVADSLHPARLYLNDFDNNGTRECILTYYKSDGKSYPYYLKDDMVKQIPTLRKKFVKHTDYAGKTMEEIFSKDQLASSDVKTAYEFHSCIFMNAGNGRFSKKPLPAEAQFSPVYAILADDFDRDGLNDMLLAGNLYGLKPELGKYDANYGDFYKGLPDNKFLYESPANSGFFYKGQARDMISIRNVLNKQLILLGRNNESLMIFENNTK
jgi:enediyne biosynthesis protein E4